MNAVEVRERANSFDPMKAVHWTPWQALAWAVHRDVDRVRECSWIWLEKGPPCPVEGAELGPFRKIWDDMHTNDAVAEGWAKLWRALESGRVTSSGVDVATGRRREISSLEWLDLEVTEPCTIEPEGYRPVRADGPQCYPAGTDYSARPRPEPSFVDVRVLVADVLKEFLAKEGDAAAPAALKPNVNAILLNDYLKKTATPDHTQKALRILAEQAFPDNHITDARFRSALQSLPAEQKRPRGGTPRTMMKLRNSAK